MSAGPSPDGRYVRVPAASRRDRPVPGREALLLGALAFGLMMLAIQLWLLTVALELYLAGDGERVWGLAVGSGCVFVGGLIAVWLLSRRPRIGA
ncbi:MAG: hypothetical protein IT303_11755 [Dehalococcoidia bacterium]|nr:hypothetical protein [Dehalococcoidia bacterium]